MKTQENKISPQDQEMTRPQRMENLGMQAIIIQDQEIRNRRTDTQATQTLQTSVAERE